MATIPVSQIVDVVPSVLAAGGTALDLSGFLLSTSSRVPIGTFQSFADLTAVEDYFGATSTEATLASIYFLGFDNSTKKPGALLVAQYNTASVNAYLRGADVSDLTLTELQAFNGEVLSVTIDGVLKSATINNLNTATSFSNAAQLIGNDLGIHGTQAAAITGSISTTTLTVTAVGSGTIPIGGVLVGAGVTAGTFITAQVTGTTGSTGTYTVSASQSVGSESITVYSAGVTYDSISGGFDIFSGTTGASSTMTFGSGALATSIALTQATGAVLSQGATAATPAAFMGALIAETTDWATFFLSFDPDAGSGNAIKLEFSDWTNSQNNRYAFMCWDTDASPTNTVPATASMGYALQQSKSSGTCLIYAPDASLAAFASGYVASLDFEATNGRATAAFRSQTGLTASVTNATVAQNLISNGYNFYGAYATAAQGFNWFQEGTVSGPFQWLDSYVDQIWLNNSFQLALAELMSQALSIPFNPAGYALVEGSLKDPIDAGLNFGAFRAGVTLSASQRQAVNAAAGVNIADTLQTQGWYLQVRDAVPATRQLRGSPPCLFFYTDGESVQKIRLSSVDVQ